MRNKYFFIVKTLLWKYDIIQLDIEYQYWREPCNIWRDYLLKNNCVMVEWMYWIEDYAIEALKLKEA